MKSLFRLGSQMPPLGFRLESTFGEGKYSEVAALLLFYVIIATIGPWVRPRLVPFYLLGAVDVLPSTLRLACAGLVCRKT